MTRGWDLVPPVRSLSTVPALLGAPPPPRLRGPLLRWWAGTSEELATRFDGFRALRVVGYPCKADPGPG